MPEPLRMPGPRVKRMSEAGRKWLVGLECGSKGARLKAYRDTKGIPTIGVGQIYWLVQGKLKRVEMGDQFNTLSDALEAFYRRLQAYEATVDASTRDDISQTAFDAFTSFCWNIGEPALRVSRAVRVLNEYAPVDQVASAIENWNHDPQLVSRRKCETELLRRGVYLLQGQV